MIVAVIMRLTCVCWRKTTWGSVSRKADLHLVGLDVVPWQMFWVFPLWIKTGKVSARVKSRTGVHGELTWRAVSGDLRWGKSMWDVHCLKVSGEARCSSDGNSPLRQTDSFLILRLSFLSFWRIFLLMLWQVSCVELQCVSLTLEFNKSDSDWPWHSCEKHISILLYT